MAERKHDPDRVQRMVDRAKKLLSDPEAVEQLRREREDLKRHTEKYTEARRWPYGLKCKNKKKKKRRDRKIRAAT